MVASSTTALLAGIGSCFAAAIYEVGRPTRLSSDEALELESQWQDFGEPVTHITISAALCCTLGSSCCNPSCAFTYSSSDPSQWQTALHRSIGGTAEMCLLLPHCVRPVSAPPTISSTMCCVLVRTEEVHYRYHPSRISMSIQGLSCCSKFCGGEVAAIRALP